MHRRLHSCWLVVLALLGVAEPVSAQAVRLRPTATPIYTGSEGVGFVEPRGVACRNSMLVIADSGNARLLKYEVADGVVTPATILAGSGLQYPTRVDIDAEGGIWALDGKSLRIGRLGPSGEFAGHLEIPGEDTRSLIPRAFRFGPRGNLHVLDVRGGRILVVTPAGQTTREIALPGEIAFPSDLALDSRGRVFVLDSVGHRVFSVAVGDDAVQPLSDELSEDLDFATAIAVDERGHLFLADRNGGGIVILGRDGSFRGRQSTYGWKIGMLRYPSDLCIDGDLLFVADSGNNRVQAFQISE